MCNKWVLLAAAMLGGATTLVAVAQPYPAKAVRIVVPFPPGGVTDILGRAVAQRLTDAFGQSFVIDNRPGAGGTLGSNLVAQSAADGYTLVLGTMATHAISASVYSKPPYDPAKDFAAVCLVASTPAVLLVNPGVMAHAVSELVTLAKTSPGKLNYASPGNGTAPHLMTELLKSRAGIEMTHIPYKGNPPALTDLMGGQVQVSFPDLTSALSYIKAGKLRALAVTGAKRSPLLPDLVTFNEIGMPEFEGAWYGFFAPAGTSKEIVSKLNEEIVRGLALPEMKKSFAAQGAEAIGNTPHEFSVYQHNEIAKWARVVKASGVRLD